MVKIHASLGINMTVLTLLTKRRVVLTVLTSKAIANHFEKVFS